METLNKLIQQEQKINGKLLPKYLPVLVLKSVLCKSCGNMIAPNSIMYKDNVTELQALAEKVHADGVTANRVLCTKPQLLIVWDNAFIDKAFNV